MEFAKYYDVSDIVNTMVKSEEIDCYPTGEEKFDGVYVCMVQMISGSVVSIKDIMKNMRRMKTNTLQKEIRLVFMM